jgi:hypothetical protein
MASLALGAVGAVVGNILLPGIGGSIGWALGSALGSALFQPKVDGPRLNNLRLQTSQYGWFIPIVYGTVRVEGCVIWQTDLQEHSHTSGGKGGPEVTNYTYTASFAVAMCGGVINNVQRIWADGEVIYDKSPGAIGSDLNLPLTIYFGTETQTPDPTIESVEGAGQVPAHRGTAYVVFTDLDLGRWGNRIPNLSFEVVKSAAAYPWVFSPFNLAGAAVATGARNDHDTITVGSLGANSLNGLPYTLATYDHSGTLISTLIATTLAPADSGSATLSQGGRVCHNFPRLSTQKNPSTAGPPDEHYQSAWYLDGVRVAGPIGPDFDDDGGTFESINNDFWYDEDESCVYAIGGNTRSYLCRYEVANLIPAANPSIVTLLPHESPSTGGGGGQWALSLGGDGFIYVNDTSTTSGGAVVGTLYKFDKDLNLVHRWLATDFAAVAIPPAQRGPGFYTTYPAPINGVIVEGNKMYYQSGGVGACGFVLQVDGTTLSCPADTFAVLNLGAYSNTGLVPVTCGNGIVLTAFGLVSLNPPPNGTTLDVIVADICDQAGVESYDVTDLEGVPVRGFAITSQSSARSNLQPLQDAFFFDAVESDGTVKFIRRGKASAGTIDANDIAARNDGAELPVALGEKRAQEEDLPKTINLQFVNYGSDYQTGNQVATRQVTLSELSVQLDVAIVMTDAEAKAAADQHLFSRWLARQQFTFSTPMKYLQYEPTDVVTISGYEVLLLEKEEDANGVVNWQAELTGRSTSVQAAVAPVTDATTTTIATIATATEWKLLDIAAASDSDTGNMYVAMTGQAAGWKGATLLKSLDNGTTYTSIGFFGTPATMGKTLGALGNFFSGYVFDESNTVDVLITGVGTLASATEGQVLAGANRAVIGDEIIAFKTATLIATNTYRLGGLLRGLRGTEFAMPAHAGGEAFVLLPATSISEPLTERDVPVLYKIAPLGGTESMPVQFTNTMNALRPYAPVQLAGGVDASGNVTLQWVRRSRVRGDWLNGSDVPIGEALEQYVVEIWDSTYQKCAATITCSTQLTTFTAAQQVAAFGAVQQHIYWTVFQVGDYVNGRRTRAVTDCTGVADAAPATPIPPYGGTDSNVGHCTLPTTADDLPAVNSLVVNYTWSVGQVWLVSFTTKASSGLSRLSINEFTGPPTLREGRLSAMPCGVALGPGCYQLGTTLLFEFWVGSGNPDPARFATLQPSTKYYVWATTTANVDAVAFHRV